MNILNDLDFKKLIDKFIYLKFLIENLTIPLEEYENSSYFRSMKNEYEESMENEKKRYIIDEAKLKLFCENKTRIDDNKIDKKYSFSCSLNKSFQIFTSSLFNVPSYYP